MLLLLCGFRLRVEGTIWIQDESAGAEGCIQGALGGFEDFGALRFGGFVGLRLTNIKYLLLLGDPPA